MNDHIREKIHEAVRGFEAGGRDPRVLILGKTGNGKSSLINAVFGEERVATSTVASCTRGFSDHAFEGGPGSRVVIVDSPGVGEVGYDEEYTRNAVAEAARCDAVVLVLKADDRAYRADLDLVRRAASDPAFSAEKPILVALNQIDKLDPVEEWLPPYDLSGGPSPADAEKVRHIKQKVAEVLRQFGGVAGGHPLRVVPMMGSRTSRQGRLFGVDRLKLELFTLLPEAARYRFARTVNLASEASRAVLHALDVEADTVIRAAAVTAGGAVAANPVPVSDLALLLPIQIGMVVMLGAIYGKSVDARSSVETVTALGAGYAARSIFQGVISLLPVVKNLVGPPFAAAATHGIGVAAKAYFQGQSLPSEAQLRGEVERKLREEAGRA